MKQVKKLVLLLVATASLVSCSKDDSAPSLQGKWQFAKSGGISDGQELLEDYEGECSTSHDNVEFLPGGVFKVNSYDGECTLESGQGTWAKDGSSLNTSIEGDDDAAQILKLTNTTLKIKFDNDQILVLSKVN